MIFSQIIRPKADPTPEGSRYRNTYQECLDNDGKLTLERIGQTDVYAMIQEDLENSSIEVILHKFAMGDLNILNQREATYCDATTMPKSLRDAQDLVIRLRDEFYTLPLEVRKEFDNSPEQYVSEMGTQEFLDKMAPYNEKIAAIAKEKSDKEYRKKVQEGAKLNIDIEREMAAQKGVEQ